MLYYKTGSATFFSQRTGFKMKIGQMFKKLLFEGIMLFNVIFIYRVHIGKEIKLGETRNRTEFDVSVRNWFINFLFQLL